MTRLLNWWLRRFIRECDLPDIPAVRRLARAAWWSGMLLGARDRHVEELRQETLRAIAAHRWQEQP